MKHPFMHKSHDNGTRMTRIWLINADITLKQSSRKRAQRIKRKSVG